MKPPPPPAQTSAGSDISFLLIIHGADAEPGLDVKAVLGVRVIVDHHAEQAHPPVPPSSVSLALKFRTASPFHCTVPVETK
jgi:hypothetical protein